MEVRPRPSNWSSERQSRLESQHFFSDLLVVCHNILVSSFKWYKSNWKPILIVNSSQRASCISDCPIQFLKKNVSILQKSFFGEKNLILKIIKLIKEEGEKLARRARTLRSRDVTQYVYARFAQLDFERTGIEIHIMDHWMIQYGHILHRWNPLFIFFLRLFM